MSLTILHKTKKWRLRSNVQLVAMALIICFILISEYMWGGVIDNNVKYIVFIFGLIIQYQMYENQQKNIILITENELIKYHEGKSIAINSRVKYTIDKNKLLIIDEERGNRLIINGDYDIHEIVEIIERIKFRGCPPEKMILGRKT